MLTQIYGITHPDDAAAVNALGPDHVGLVLAEEEEVTWDGIDAQALADIRPLLGDVRVVALSLATEVDRILRTAEVVEAHIVHVARAVDHMSVDDVERLRDRLHPTELMITIPVRDRSSLVSARAYAPVCDWLLLDSAHPESGVVGATGHTHDWSISATIVASVSTPVFLAGGLGPENVIEAIAAVRPAGVDSETRTSRVDDRRRKDLDRVRAFIELARGADA